MATPNPSYAASSIITDIESQLGTPGIDSATYMPWISDANQIVWETLAGVGQQVKERLFGASGTVPLVQNTLETFITASIPQFDSFIKVEIQYGAAGDLRSPATKLPSKANWGNLAYVSTTYRPKDNPLYYREGDNLGVIPVAPESGANAYIEYVKRPQQLTVSTDVIDLPYRFIYPIKTYVLARAIRTAFQDFATAKQLDQQFRSELEAIAIAADSQWNENDGSDAVQVETQDPLYDNPLGRTW